MTSTYTFLATYPADTTPARRWEIWEAVAPLFERHGFHGVTIDELAAEAGLRTTELYRQFSSKQVLALFPLSRSNGIYRSWVRRAAMPPAGFRGSRGERCSTSPRSTRLPGGSRSTWPPR